MNWVEEYLRGNYNDGFPGRRRREKVDSVDDLIEILVDDLRNRYTFNMSLQDIAAGLIERLVIALEEAEAQIPNWICVHDSLPTQSENVLVLDIYGGMYTGHYCGGNCWALLGLNDLYDDVTHWMHLPELPKEEEE